MRHATKTTRLLAVILAPCFLFGGRLVQAESTRPNIVLIMADDMGFSDIGCYGGEIQTPHLDQLAAGGVRLTQFYNTARCCPTRASLLTGLYPHQAGMGHMNYDGKKPGYEGDLRRDAATIAEVLRLAGYGTYMSGKWHVTRHNQADSSQHNWPRQRGFDRFYGTITGAGSFYDPATLARENTFITPENDEHYQPETYYYTDAITDNAISFVRDHLQADAANPFFLYVSYTAAHWPMHALPEDIAKYHGVYDSGYSAARTARLKRVRDMGLVDPAWSLSPQAGNWNAMPHKQWESRCMEVYAAMVDRMDRDIGQLVTFLREQDQLEDTLIFYLQDNGGCAEGVGRKSNAEKIADVEFEPLGRDGLQTKVIPVQTRDGRPVRMGPEAQPGSEDTYIAYGRGWANVSNTPFREYKHWVHEGGISTPLIIHWPARIALSQRNELFREPAHLIDIMTTCLDAVGAEFPTEIDGATIQPPEGVSLLPALQGGSLNRSQPIYWEHEGNRAIRDGKWKLVAKGPSGAWQLHDMEADRTELQDLAADHPGEVDRLAGLWEDWARRARVLPWIWDPPYARVGGE